MTVNNVTIEEIGHEFKTDALISSEINILDDDRVSVDTLRFKSLLQNPSVKLVCASTPF